jgi:hypothetical protein
MDWLRLGNVIACGALAYALLQYAPLVPKASTALDDFHALRLQAEGWKASIDGIRAVLEKPRWFGDENGAGPCACGCGKEGCKCGGSK